MKRRVATNLSRRDLVERAKSLGLNLSEEASAKAEQLRWLAENEKAIDYYNSFVKKIWILRRGIPRVLTRPA